MTVMKEAFERAIQKRMDEMNAKPVHATLCFDGTSNFVNKSSQAMKNKQKPPHECHRQKDN